MSVPNPVRLQSLRKNLERALSTPPSIDYPIKLTAHSPYLMGRAALVFAGPHILNPADNFAEYGWETIEEAYGSLVHNTPHDGACVIAWFRPPVAGRKYNVNFSCEGLRGHSLVLVSGGDTETINISTENYEIPEALPLAKADAGTMFEAKDLNWKWFSLSSDQHWRLLSFEVVQLPD
jgi:hypothetical protein